ncbi:MAG: alpha/beta fold hydrolase [Conexibacter sp.]
MSAAEATAPVPAVTRTRIRAGGTQPRLLQAGPADASEAVVFVHGNPGSCDDWERLAGAVGASGVRALALDLPDFGETIAPAGFVHDVPTHAGFLQEALDVLGVERVHLVIHDFGGPIGLVWAAMHIDRVASVTLVNTGILPGYRWHRLARVWRTPVLGELFQAISHPRVLRRMLPRQEPRGLPAEFLDRVHYGKRTRRAVLELYRATDDPGAAATEFAAFMASQDIPALVVWGEHDAYLPSSYAERQRDAFPSADVHILSASGHWPFADAPETVERLLVEFVASVRAAAA